MLQHPKLDLLVSDIGLRWSIVDSIAATAAWNWTLWTIRTKVLLQGHSIGNMAAQTLLMW
jgi:hypothetical protein